MKTKEMHFITENIKKLTTHIPESVKIIAISKLKPIEDIQIAYDSGHRYFGENKTNEIKMKWEKLPKDIEWHFVGHLQTNKVKYIAPFVHLIHSVDSYRLLSEINKRAIRNDRVINCLLQLYIAEEESKHGFLLEEVKEMLESQDFANLKNIRICGVMGMATFTENKELVRKEFQTLHTYFKEIKESYFKDCEHFKECSMGMTDDYEIALEEGSTMVRIGSAIFGERDYK